MKSASILSIVCSVCLMGIEAAISEVQLLDYLAAVGTKCQENRSQDPLDCINNSWPDWNIRKPSVRQFVGIVCERHQLGKSAFGSDRITEGCILFERVAVRYLGGLWTAVNNGAHHASRLVNLDVRYSTGIKIYYAQNREMFPSVCGKLLGEINGNIPSLTPGSVDDATRACRVLKADARQYLVQLNINIQTNVGDQYKITVNSESRPGATITFDQVKTLLPGICKSRQEWNAISSSCTFFFEQARLILNGEVGRMQKYDAKPFVASVCNHEEVPQCREFWTGRLAAFLEPWGARNE